MILLQQFQLLGHFGDTPQLSIACSGAVLKSTVRVPNWNVAWSCKAGHRRRSKLFPRS